MLDEDLFSLLDGNAAAGVLQEIFGREMTDSPTRCAACGREGAMGTLHLFNRAPGAVLRCPRCQAVMLRVVETTRAIYLDARGVSCLRLARSVRAET